MYMNVIGRAFVDAYEPFLLFRVLKAVSNMSHILFLFVGQKQRKTS